MKKKRAGIEIINDIEENEQKINHHGKRADAIVKACCNTAEAAADKKNQLILINWQMNTCASPTRDCEPKTKHSMRY